MEDENVSTNATETEKTEGNKPLEASKALQAKARNSIWFIVLLCVVLVGAVALFAVSCSKTKEQKTGVTTEELGDSLHAIGELSTAEYDYTMCQVMDKTKHFIVDIPFTGTKVIYSYEGTIKAGLDFNDVDIAVNEVKKIVNISLPEVKILSSELDQDSLNVYDEKQGMFNKFDISDLNDAQKQLKEEAEEKAISKGLLNRAEENAKTILTQMVGSFVDLEEYTVRFQ